MGIQINGEKRGGCVSRRIVPLWCPFASRCSAPSRPMRFLATSLPRQESLTGNVQGEVARQHVYLISVKRCLPSPV